MCGARDNATARLLTTNAYSAKREERIPTRCKNINDLLSIPGVDY